MLLAKTKNKQKFKRIVNAYNSFNDRMYREYFDMSIDNKGRIVLSIDGLNISESTIIIELEE